MCNTFTAGSTTGLMLNSDIRYLMAVSCAISLCLVHTWLSHEDEQLGSHHRAS